MFVYVTTSCSIYNVTSKSIEIHMIGERRNVSEIVRKEVCIIRNKQLVFDSFLDPLKSYIYICVIFTDVASSSLATLSSKEVLLKYKGFLATTLPPPFGDPQYNSNRFRTLLVNTMAAQSERRNYFFLFFVSFALVILSQVI